MQDGLKDCKLAIPNREHVLKVTFWGGSEVYVFSRWFWINGIYTSRIVGFQGKITPVNSGSRRKFWKNYDQPQLSSQSQRGTKIHRKKPLKDRIIVTCIHTHTYFSIIIYGIQSLFLYLNSGWWNHQIMSCHRCSGVALEAQLRDGGEGV